MDISPLALRKVIGHFATGVCVITARLPDGSPCGITINSLTSVSLNPPLLLFCLAHTSILIPAFTGASRSFFRVHILDHQQELLSQSMTAHDPRAWTNIPTDPDGCPALSGGVAWLRCHTYAHYDGGDHLIIVGQVVAMDHHASKQPLLYYRGTYHQLKE